MRKISVIGHFDFGKENTNGQTVKVKIVTDELCARFGTENVIKIDTAGGKSVVLKVPFQCIAALKKSNNIVIFSCTKWCASERDAMKEYGVTLTKLSDVKDADCVIVAVAHNEFKALSLSDIDKMFKNMDNDKKVLVDVKGLYKVEDLKMNGMKYWRL